MPVRAAVSLTDAEHDFAMELVRSGRYPDLSAVLGDGVEALRRQLETEAADADDLRSLLTQRAGGEFIPSDEMNVRVEAMIGGKRRALGL